MSELREISEHIVALEKAAPRRERRISELESEWLYKVVGPYYMHDPEKARLLRKLKPLARPHGNRWWTVTGMFSSSHGTTLEQAYSAWLQETYRLQYDKANGVIHLDTLKNTAEQA